MNRSLLRRERIPRLLPSPLPPPQPRAEDLARSQPRCVCFLGTASFPGGHKGTAGTQHPQPKELAALHQPLLNADDNDERAELGLKTCPRPPATAPSMVVLRAVVDPKDCIPSIPTWLLLPDLLPPPATPGMGRGACRRPRKTSPLARSKEMNLVKAVGPRAATPQLLLLHYTGC